MAAPGVLALSLSSEVTKIGGIAGLVAILGIALLSALFFAQARELKRLREWAGRAPERAREVEEQAARAAEAARARPAPSVTPAVPVAKPASPVAPAPSAAPAPAPAPPPSPSAAAPSAPLVPGAGVGAPALLSATRFRGVVPPPPAPAAPGAPASAGAASSPTPALAALTRPPAPARTAPSGNGRSEVPPSRPPIAPATAAGAARAAVPPPPPRTPPAAPAQPSPASRSAPPARSSGRRPAVIVLVTAVLLGVAALTFGAIQLLSSGSDTSPTPGPRRAAATPTTPVGKGRNAAPFSNGSVTVAVLNGTPVAGLAKRVADQLVARGFKQGTVTNASEQTRSATLVSFLPGRKRAGTVVAKTLKAVALAPIDPTTRAIACPGAQPCPDVVVTVGSDRAG